MTIMSGLGIVLSLVFGCLLLALVAELYYLLWWKKQRIISNNNNNNNNGRIEQDYSNHAKEMFYLFCWDKPTTLINNHINNINNNNNNNHSSSNHTGLVTSESNHYSCNNNNVDSDIEMGFDARKDLLLKALGEDGVDSDIMKLAGHPRFLFTIKEETKEDLESDDGRSKNGDKSIRKLSRTKSLSDLIMALETHTPYLSPLASPNHNKNMKVSINNYNYYDNSSNNYNYNNPLFESSVEAELNRLRSSPPPKFKFLRDAEEKLYRRLLEEANKSGIFSEAVLGNSHAVNISSEGDVCGEKNEEFFRKNSEFNGGKNKEKENEIIHCSSKVLPLASSLNSDNLSSNSSVESKQLCLH